SRFVVAPARDAALESREMHLQCGIDDAALEMSADRRAVAAAEDDVAVHFRGEGVSGKGDHFDLLVDRDVFVLLRIAIPVGDRRILESADRLEPGGWDPLI